ncbi:MAG TPA: amino acid ABC transporter permease [Coriobacteriia bacterium]|nr:amino acid ABC transporter permease [Coriobacteriia bacterium]
MTIALPSIGHHKRWLLTGILTVLLLATVVAPAFGADVLKGTTFTLSQTTGGKPTRFTFTSTIAQPLDSVALTFPEGFNLSKAKIDVVTLDGLKRVRIKVQQGVSDQTVRLVFDPAVSPGYDLRVQLFDVVLPMKGGQFSVKVDYSSGGVEGSTTTTPFSTETPSRTEAVSSWLEQQGWVKSWNSVQFANIFLNPQMIVTSIPLLFTGWLISIALVVVAFPFAIAGGLLLAFAKMSKLWPVRLLSNIYINVIRGTPLFLQIFIAFVGLPIAGLRAPLFPTGVLVLALNSSAYLAEIFRAGIQSIHKGQFEAASSLGMNYAQAMAFVIIPQTVKRVLPTMTSEFILLFKDTALLSAVGVFELMLYSNSLATRTGSLTPFMVAAVYYLIVTVPLINWVGKLEARLAVAEGGATPTDKKRRNWPWRPASAGPESELLASSTVNESR